MFFLLMLLQLILLLFSINSPNNPSGVVYTVDTIEKMCDLLREKEQEYGHPIFVITDEPYRELVYDDTEVPYIMY